MYVSNSQTLTANARPVGMMATALMHSSVLRLEMDDLGRPIIGARMPTGARGVSPSMLHFGDELRQTARRFGMGNLAARVCQALVEQGSLREASRSMGISHNTAASEIADAMKAAQVHSQSALVYRLAEHRLRNPLVSERTVSLLMAAFGLRLRDAKVATLRAAGLNRPEAAEALGVSQWAIQASCSTVFATLGVTKAPELTRLLIDLLLTADLAEQAPGYTVRDRSTMTSAEISSSAA